MNIHSYTSLPPIFRAVPPHSKTEGTAKKVSAGPAYETKVLKI